METMTPTEAKRLSPGLLAFYGDSVYEIMVRRFVVSSGDRPSAKLHEESVKYARAGFQASAYDRILPMLSEAEADILRRGRNSTGLTAPKSSNQTEYHKATAVEALFGYLSLTGEEKRLEELFSAIIPDDL